MTIDIPDLASLDVDAYLRRIDYTGDRQPGYTLLESLHLAHASHIPFENLDVLLGRPIRLDLASLQAKLVDSGRGGYCFEQNLLFAAVLQRLGLAFTPLAARVRVRGDRVLPRTHMLLLVECDDGRWVSDVGFGVEGLLLPVPFAEGHDATQFGRRYRVLADAGAWLLQVLLGTSWINLYSFTLEPQRVADYEMANYYTSTHPDSRFVKSLTVQLPTPSARKLLRNRELTIDDGNTVTTRVLSGDDELLRVLADEFGLVFPPGTRFPVPGPAD